MSPRASDFSTGSTTADTRQKPLFYNTATSKTQLRPHRVAGSRGGGPHIASGNSLFTSATEQFKKLKAALLESPPTIETPRGHVCHHNPAAPWHMHPHHLVEPAPCQHLQHHASQMQHPPNPTKKRIHAVNESPLCGGQLPQYPHPHLPPCRDICGDMQAYFPSRLPQESPEPPELVVTRLQRPSAPLLNYSGDECFNSLATDFGKILGNTFTSLNRSPPPKPIPGRPIERFAPCLLPPPPPPRTQKCFLSSLCEKPKPLPPKRRAGVCGMADDILAIGVGLTGEGCVKFADTYENFCGSQTKAARCECIPPPRYPDSEFGYLDAAPEPTQATGIFAVDFVNKILDDAAYKTAPKWNEPLPVIPNTEMTGNSIVDSINTSLDNYFGPEPIAPPKMERVPMQGWQRYFPCLQSPPPPPPEMHHQTFLEYAFPCFGGNTEKPYQEKFGERICPSCFGRDEFYCPHCDRNRHTGKRRFRPGDFLGLTSHSIQAAEHVEFDINRPPF